MKSSIDTNLERYGTGAGDIAGKLVSFTSLGCYPVYYVTSHDELLCSKCANELENDEDNDAQITGADANWEDPEMYCECGERIESAYAEDDATEGK